MNDRKYKIYLAGTIYKEESDINWKNDLISQFVDVDQKIQFIDPDPQNECDVTMVQKDKKKINSCDCLVAYIRRPSFGTAMEIYHAFLKNDISIIIISPDYYYKNDLWISSHAHKIVDTIKDAADTIKFLIE